MCNINYYYKIRNIKYLERQRAIFWVIAPTARVNVAIHYLNKLLNNKQNRRDDLRGNRRCKV